MRPPKDVLQERPVGKANVSLAIQAAPLHCATSRYFEWTGSKNRQPHYFTRADGQPIALAGP